MYVSVNDDFAEVKPLFTQLITTFEIADALRGEITGNWEEDKIRLLQNRCICTQKLYNQAYQEHQQP